MYSRTTSAKALSVLAASTIATFTAHAQDNGQGIEALEEIIVTAERREQNLQDMSVAITALGGDDLLAQGKTRLEDAVATVPGVRIQENSLTGGTPFIRGVGPALSTDPSAAVSLDGVYQSEGLFGSQFDVARVEVLRGPQGTFYGRNATAGSVNVITNDPTNQFEGSAGIQLGNYSAMRIDGMLNVPLSDNLAVRAAFYSSKRDGFMSNGTMDDDTQSGRLKVKYTPSEAVSILLAAARTNLGGNGPGNTQAPISSHASNPWFTTDLRGKQNSTRTSYYGQLDVDLGFGTLTYQPSYYENDIYGDFNFLGTRGLVVSNNRNKQHTEELRLTSASEQPIQWTVGLYYLDNKGTANPVAPRLAADRSDRGHANPSQSAISPTRTESKAVFGQVTVPVTDQFRIIAGGRYTHDEKSAGRTTFAQLLPAPPGAAVSYPGAPIISISPSVSQTTKKFTYKAGVEYDLTDDSLLYATYSTGFKAGGINNPTTNDFYKPEELAAIELGSKNRFLDNRLQTNLAAFYYDYTDYQVFTVAFTSVPPVVGVLNAASATLWGIEFENTFAITANDRLDASVAYNNNKFDEFTYFSDTYPAPVGIDRSGQQLPQAPKWTAILGYNHTFDLSNGAGLTVGAQGRYYSSHAVSIEPALDSFQPAYTLVDATVSYAPAEGEWSVNAYLNNATNEVVRQFTQAQPPTINQLRLGAPRTYGVGITAKF